MKFQCICGNTLSNAGSPNSTEHLLIDSCGIERLQQLVEEHDVAKQGDIRDWSDKWEDSGAIEIWKCNVCNRLYVSPKDGFDKTVVYNVEQVGI
jgi:hypothetical protein